MADAREIFAAMAEKVKANPGKVAGLKAGYQFELTGEGGGVFHAVLADGNVDIGEGALTNAPCTLIMSSSDFQALMAGKLNATSAFMSGKLKIKGDMGLALKLQAVIG